MKFTSFLSNFSLLRLLFPANKKKRAVRRLRLWQGPLAGRGLDSGLQSMPEFAGIMLLFIQVLGKQQICVLTKRLGSMNPPVHWITKSVVSKGNFSNLTFSWDSCKDCSPLGKKKSNKKKNLRLKAFKCWLIFLHVSRNSRQ